MLRRPETSATFIIILLEQRASPIFIRHYIAERQSLLLSCCLYHRHVSLVESAEDELCTFLHVRTKRRHVSNEYIAVDISNHYIEAVFNVIKNRRIAKQHIHILNTVQRRVMLGIVGTPLVDVVAKHGVGTKA